MSFHCKEGWLITVDGDGRDSNGDGRPDAKMNPDRIYVDFNRTVEFSLSKLSTLSFCR